ncbi:hypothetical protein KUTeg_013975 [Tegillarca granosa]|uniref:Centriolar and ciliogenesis-associated protein HYLS1 C-terminal domain-containing protein n=1 Tax=Tegillarca granosa TaxID=220873 RepID=A0ABQ9EYU0_TEGGR|nr:hypothetical protein KUTeg_013975 [Tegillarca granosa]
MADLSDDFTDEEIREELSKLGYSNVPADRFQEFKKDLRVLVQHERSKTSSQNTSVSSHGHNDMLNGHNGFGAGGNPLIKKPLPRDPILSGPHYDLHSGITTDSSRLEFPDNVSETESEKRFVKRKVLRRKDDGSKVIDESITESEAGSTSNQKLIDRVILASLHTDYLQMIPVQHQKPQRVYVANSYVVPTDKKRQNLRWQIRMDMAEGQMPPHGFYHEY